MYFRNKVCLFVHVDVGMALACLCNVHFKPFKANCSVPLFWKFKMYHIYEKREETKRKEKKKMDQA
jgi:hypothetical protein